MLIIPAIDLKDGKCVRLKQGAMNQATVFSDDPTATAREWMEKGARRLHLVDLNGAAAGRPKNENVIKSIAAANGDKVTNHQGGGKSQNHNIQRKHDHRVT
jgi:phosphoribosylformimino-5-aminoimidazole carboxamide ribotide isomerase